MSTKEENCLAVRAHNEIGMCCQTLCHKQTVLDYIEELEDKLIEAEEKIVNLEIQVKELDDGLSRFIHEQG